MNVSVFDLFKVGIGPSSSHTVGPMIAARRFAQALKKKIPSRIQIDLYGSLAMTGIGHGTDKALILGLMGHDPETVPVERIETWMQELAEKQSLSLLGKSEIPFERQRDIVFHRREVLDYHPNGMIFKAWDDQEKLILEENYYSVGGGFIHNDEGDLDHIEEKTESVPYPFTSGKDLLVISKEHGLTIAQIMMANEQTWRKKEDVTEGLLKIWAEMEKCVYSGFSHPGILPGSLKVRRRAPELYKSLRARGEASLIDPMIILDWVNLYALAVNEENAAGGRVVTAPTNGAAGILPAVMMYYKKFTPRYDDQGLVDMLLTAGAIAHLYKLNASISGAEVGCQGEVGVASSMAAASLAAVLGGTVAQVENAAEIAMEHNLGLTCDPIGGLVQIPCIERNAMGAVKAITAARMALQGDGSHFVSLDSVIKTMRRTGEDMQSQYKEPSEGGLAVNVTEC